MADPKDILRGILEEGVRAIAPASGAVEVRIERPRDPTHGDFACNVALQLARALKRKPRDIAEEIQRATAKRVAESGLFDTLEIAGAGFLNARLSAGAKHQVIHRVLREGPDFGRERPAKRERVQVEFVSANPTGPLHVGHGRGAAYGASLANLLEFAGHDVQREFYINDAGRQMDILALSVWLRYLEARGESVAFPADGYRGEYVREIGASLARAEDGRFARGTA